VRLLSLTDPISTVATVSRLPSAPRKVGARTEGARLSLLVAQRNPCNQLQIIDKLLRVGRLVVASTSRIRRNIVFLSGPNRFLKCLSSPTIGDAPSLKSCYLYPGRSGLLLLVLGCLGGVRLALEQSQTSSDSKQFVTI
jgi:hypothetical protein